MKCQHLFVFVLTSLSDNKPMWHSKNALNYTSRHASGPRELCRPISGLLRDARIYKSTRPSSLPLRLQIFDQEEVEQTHNFGKASVSLFGPESNIYICINLLRFAFRAFEHLMFAPSYWLA